MRFVPTLLLALTLAVGAPAQQGPKTVSVKRGDWFSVGDLKYRVVQVQTNLREYVQRFGQRRTPLQPGYVDDRLVVLDVEVENPTDAPREPLGFIASLIDTSGSASGEPKEDIRLRSFVNDKGSPALPRASDWAQVAPSGRMRFALVFSVPGNSQPLSLHLRPSMNMVMNGSIVRQPVGGAVVVVSL